MVVLNTYAYIHGTYIRFVKQYILYYNNNSGILGPKGIQRILYKYNDTRVTLYTY